MAESPLTQREFDVWREGDNAFKARLEQHLIAQQQVNTDTEARLKVLEDQHERANTRTGYIAAIVAGFAGTIVHTIFHKLGW